MDRSPNKVGLLHDTIQVGIKFVGFATDHDSKDNVGLSFFSVKKKNKNKNKN